MKFDLNYKRIKLSDGKILKKYLKFKRKYTKYISCKNNTYLAIFFSIMIMENYNRPWYLRLLEYTIFIYRKIIYKEACMSLGIMQVRTSKIIGNIKSIKLADEIIYNEYTRLKTLTDFEKIEHIAYKYNPSNLYKEEIYKIYSCVQFVEVNK